MAEHRPDRVDPHDIRELRNDSEAYAAELTARWGGLLSYRYIGRRWANMDVGDDIDATQRDLEGKGLRFINDRPVDYQMGRGNQLEPRFGTSVWFAQHDEDGYDKFMAMVAASRAGAAGR